MNKTVTFSFSSKNFEGTGATEIFTFKELGMANGHCWVALVQ